MAGMFVTGGHMRPNRIARATLQRIAGLADGCPPRREKFRTRGALRKPTDARASANPSRQGCKITSFQAPNSFNSSDRSRHRTYAPRRLTRYFSANSAKSGKRSGVWSLVHAPDVYGIAPAPIGDFGRTEPFGKKPMIPIDG